MQRFLWLFLLASQICLTAVAHDGDDSHQHPPAERQWTLTTVKHWSAALSLNVMVAWSVRRSDGWLRPLTLNNLSPSDQQWVAERQLQIRQLNTLPEYLITSLADPTAAANPAVSPRLPTSSHKNSCWSEALAPSAKQSALAQMTAFFTWNPTAYPIMK
ncbi:MAG UNVERIFIED_CONTAM: hypothetical protein LVR18_50965 [Planctomycetaceae bacterium]|jgi:hypothetical protein